MTDISENQHDIEVSCSSDNSYKEITVGKRKVFRCSLPLCEKTFKFKSEMNRHLASHSRLRPFPCPFPNCEKTFKRQDALNNHIRLHNKVTPYCCSEENCECKFASKSALNYHLLTHFGERVYQCDYPGCNRAFTTQGQLKQHMKATNFHRKLKTISTSEASLTSCVSPVSGSTQESGGKIIVMPVITYECLKGLEKIQKKLKHSDEDFNLKPKELKDENFDSFNYLKNIYGKPGNDTKTSANEELLNKILDLDIEENPIKTEAEMKFYNALKSLLEEDDKIDRSELMKINREEIIDPGTWFRNESFLSSNL